MTGLELLTRIALESDVMDDECKCEVPHHHVTCSGPVVARHAMCDGRTQNICQATVDFNSAAPRSCKCGYVGPLYPTHWRIYLI